MAEVGVLDLRIQSEDTSSAVQSLKDLAGALRRIENAVSKMSGAKEAASAIRRIKTALQGSWGGTKKFDSLQALKDNVNALARNSTAEKLRDVASALRSYGNAVEKVNGAGVPQFIDTSVLQQRGNRAESSKRNDDKGNIVYGETKEDIAQVVNDAFRTTTENIDTATEAVQRFTGGVESMNQIMQSTAWRFNDANSEADKFAQAIGRVFEMWNSMRMAQALPDPNASAVTYEKGWSSYGEGAIEVEGTVRDATDNIAGYLGNTERAFSTAGDAAKSAEDAFREAVEKQSRLADIAEAIRKKQEEAFYASSQKPVYSMDQTNAMADNLTQLDLLNAKLREAQVKYNEFVNTLGAGDPKTVKAGLAVSDLKDKIWELEERYSKINEAPDMDRLLGMDKIGLATMKLESMKDALTEDIERGRLDNAQIADRISRIQDLSSRIEEMRAKQEEAASATHALSDAFNGLKAAINDIGIVKLIKQFTRMAKMRMLRYVIREIAKGFKEGVENVYEYNKAIGGSFQKSMDDAATALLQMKNSIGAAAAPLIQSLIPYLQIAVNWLINIVNYMNQFIALLRGQATWTHALPASTDAFQDQANAAHGASAAMKDLLADWDELNIIQSQTGGGTGTNGQTNAEDYLNMFEESAVFDNRIREIVNFIKENFDNIKKAALEIGAALLGWKLSTYMTGMIADLLQLGALGLGIKVLFDVTTMIDKEYMKTGDAGWLVANVLSTLIGAFFMNKILGTVLGGELAELSIPITLAVSATADLTTLLGSVDVSALDVKSITLATMTALKTGAAASYLSYTLLGKSLGVSLAGGGTTAITTFGVAIGLKTIVQAIKSGVTEETVKSTALSSLSIGIGAGMFAKLTGATALAALGAGGIAAGVAIATITAAIAIGALLTTDKKKIEWGNEVLTETQIQAFVNEKMFNIDVKATIQHINATVANTATAREGIRTSLTGITSNLNIVKLGLATEDTYASLRNSLFGEDGSGGVIKDLQDYAKTNAKVIELSYTLMPITDAEGEIDEAETKDAIKFGNAGWAEVERYMGSIGSKLAEALKGKTIDGLTTYDDELIAVLTEKLNNVSMAVTGAQFSSMAAGKLISGVTGETATGIMVGFQEYKNELRESLNQLLTEELTGYRSLQAFYLARGEEGDEELAKQYGDAADRLVEEWETRLNSAVEKASEQGREIIKKSMLGLFSFGPEDIHTDMGGNAADAWLQTVMHSLATAIRESEGEYSDDVQFQLERVLDAILRDTLEDSDYEAIKAAIDSGAVNYADFFTESAMNKIITMLGNSDYYGKSVAEAWEHLLTGGTEKPKVEVGVDVITDSGIEEPVEVPGVEHSAFDESVESIKETARDGYNYVMACMSAIESVMGGGSPTHFAGGFRPTNKPVVQRASGGFVRSGDLVMANENGNFEMMGRMGNQPVVANNQQIVSGITQGVSNANGDVVSELRTLGTMMQRILSKQLVAKVVPSSGMGRVNNQSAEAYNRVTG